MSSPINTSDLSVCHLHTVDNNDSDSDANGGHAFISTAERCSVQTSVQSRAEFEQSCAIFGLR